MLLTGAGSDRTKSYRTLQEIHSEQLAEFAESLPPRKGSLEADVRSKTLALARKFNPSMRRLGELSRVTSKSMSVEEKEADQKLRKSLADREKDRQAAEKEDPQAAFPDPANVSEEFEAMRWEMVRELTDLADGLSLNPARREEVALRKKILTDAASILSRPRWACEKALKKRISELKRAKYEPWTGKWRTEWGLIELIQKGTSVSGEWPRGRLRGRWNGKVLAGRWQVSRESGTFEFRLGADERSFAGSIMQGRTKQSWTGLKVQEDPK